MARDIDALINRAHTQARHHNLHGAIESLRQALTLDADHAYAHAFLAICLHDQKRLHAAEYEASAALALEPQLPFAHYAMALVALARRRFKQAEDHLNTMLSLDPDDATALRALAQLYSLSNRPGEALPLLERAREKDPDDPDNWAALADHYRAGRQFERAEQFARRALEIDPDNTDALLTMGHLLLRRGDSDEAREHALLVLRGNANHEGAIQLLSAVKARRNMFLGLWWRFNAFFAGGSLTRRVVLLISLYLVYRVVQVAAGDFGYEQAASLINIVWLAFCVYTWVGPAVFMKQLRRELEPAQLDSKY